MLHTFLLIVATAQRHPVRARRATGDDMRRLRVLVVDEQEVVHWGFKMLLARRTWVEGYTAATTTDEAVELALRDEPHVALVDAAVGADSGAEVTRRLSEASPGTRVLMM